MRLIILFYLLTAVEAHAQSVTTLIGGRSAGLCNASITLSDDWSLFNSIGGVAQVKKLSVAAAQEIRPAIAVARRFATVVNVPFKPGTASIGAFRFGGDSYNESLIVAGYSNRFGIASMGASACYVQYAGEGVGVVRAVTFNVGGFADITPQVSVAAMIHNVNQPALSQQDGDRLAAKLRAGIRFRPTTTFGLYTEIEKDINFDPVIKCAAEYILKKKIFIRTGVRVNPASVSAGLGYVTFRLSIDYATAYFAFLGTTHQVSVTYHFKRRATS